MKSLQWILAGLAAGTAGALLWGGISYATNYEIGWVACIIGALVGFAVKVSSSGGGGAPAGLVAAVIAIASILAGKYLAVEWMINKFVSLGSQVSIEDMIVRFADEAAIEAQEKGTELRWPPGQSVETATSEADYPKSIWREAQKRWEALPAEEQGRLIQEASREVASFNQAAKSALTYEGLLATFSVFDILWAVLAIGAAYKLGSGDES